MTSKTEQTIRDASEEIGSVEQLLDDIGETGNLRADDLIRLARTRLGHANGRLVEALQAASGTESANLPISEKCGIGAFHD